MGAIATLLVPTFALAHQGGDRGEGNLTLRAEHRLAKMEKKEHHFEKHGESLGKHATTTATTITKQGVRIQNASEDLLSFNARMNALIANADAADKVGLEAKFAAYTTAASNAKIEAGKAMATAGQINAANSTTTNAALITSARADLREAKGLLHDAKETFFSILRTLWK
jgi:hypothetical protein